MDKDKLKAANKAYGQLAEAEEMLSAFVPELERNLLDVLSPESVKQIGSIVRAELEQRVAAARAAFAEL